MANEEQLKDTLQVLLELNELHKQELNEVLNQVDVVFTLDQARVIKDIITGLFNLTKEVDESAYAYVHVSTVLEAFYEVLVLQKQVIKEDEFMSISERILNDKLTQLQKGKETNTSSGE